MEQYIPYITGIMSVGTFLYVIAKDLFYGGNALANRFAKLKEETDNKLELARIDYQTRLDEYANNTRVVTNQILTNIALLEKGIMEFRLNMSENYMKRDSYYRASEELKRDYKEKNEELKSDMKEGFSRVERALSDMSQAIEAARKYNNVHNGVRT